MVVLYCIVLYCIYYAYIRSIQSWILYLSILYNDIKRTVKLHAHKRTSHVTWKPSFKMGSNCNCCNQLVPVFVSILIFFTIFQSGVKWHAINIFYNKHFFVEQVNLVLLGWRRIIIWHSFLLSSLTAKQNSKFYLAANITFARL